MTDRAVTDPAVTDPVTATPAPFDPPAVDEGIDDPLLTELAESEAALPPPSLPSLPPPPPPPALPSRRGDRRPRPGAGRWSRMTLRQRLLILLTVFGAFLFIVAFTIFSSLQTLSDRRTTVIDKLDPAVLASRDLRTAMIDQEDGIRGYLLNPQDTSYLEPYNRGTENEKTAVLALDQYLEGRPNLSGLRTDLSAAINTWETQTASRTIDAVSNGDTSEVTTPEFKTASQQQFKNVRDELDLADSAINEERDAAVEDFRLAYRNLNILPIVELAGFVILGALVAVALSRSVTQPLEHLGEQVQDVADGNLSRTIVGEGPPELVNLGSDTNTMRERILKEIELLNEANDLLAQQAVELERSNADLEQFAYVASHDLQEPLRKVAGFCQLLEKRYHGQLDERADQYIFFAVDGAKRMQDLINDLLAFSRVGRTTDRFVAVSLDAALADGCDNLGDRIEESGATVDAGPLPTVQGDPRLLSAVFQNLVGNAIKFRRDEPPVVTIRATDGEDEWTISVTDNGTGIEPQYADQIFTLFQRLHSKSDYPGTGIGLSLCKKIVEFHGGGIWLDPHDSREGEGSTFRFTLPHEARLPV
jgi:signal transduction histidine kinase